MQLNHQSELLRYVYLRRPGLSRGGGCCCSAWNCRKPLGGGEPVALRCTFGLIDGVEGSPLVPAAALLPLNEQRQAQYNSELLPLVYKRVRGFLAPFLRVMNGALVPAVREGERGVLREDKNTFAYVYDTEGKFIAAFDQAPEFAVYVIPKGIDIEDYAPDFYPNEGDGIVTPSRYTFEQIASKTYLKNICKFYVSLDTVKSAMAYAILQEDKAKAILCSNEPARDRLRRLLLWHDPKDEGKPDIEKAPNPENVTEMLLLLCVTKGSKEAFVYNVTKHIVPSDLKHTSITLNGNKVSSIYNELKESGAIPVAHAHTHGQYYSMFEPEFRHALPADGKICLYAIQTAEKWSAEEVAKPSHADAEDAHFFCDLEPSQKKELGIGSKEHLLEPKKIPFPPTLQFIFTNKGFTIYTGGGEAHKINTGDFFDYETKKRIVLPK